MSSGDTSERRGTYGAGSSVVERQVHRRSWVRAPPSTHFSTERLNGPDSSVLRVRTPTDAAASSVEAVLRTGAEHHERDRHVLHRAQPRAHRLPAQAPRSQGRRRSLLPVQGAPMKRLKAEKIEVTKAALDAVTKNKRFQKVYQPLLGVNNRDGRRRRAAILRRALRALQNGRDLDKVSYRGGVE